MKLFTFWLFLMVVSLSNSLFDNKRAANELFTIRLLNEVSREYVNQSIVFSGFSTLCPLAQLALAAVGNTQLEILIATYLPKSITLIINLISEINNVLQNVKGLELKIANRLYVDNHLQLNEDFAAKSSHTFSSEVKSIDFSQREQAASQINKWVNEKTGSHIRNLVNPVSFNQNTTVALVNAIYFKGKWETSFDTHSFKFYGPTPETREVVVQGMYQSGRFKYGESEQLNAQILELNYVGEEASLLIVLPKRDSIVYDVVSTLIKFPDALAKAVNQLTYIQTVVLIPKFTIETSIDLIKMLKQMKIEKLFEPTAELDNLIKRHQGGYVSKAIQKTIFEVNEEGAAPATDNAFIRTYTAGLEKPYDSFIANRPFFFALKVNNTILFNGIFQG